MTLKQPRAGVPNKYLSESIMIKISVCFAYYVYGVPLFHVTKLKKSYLFKERCMHYKSWHEIIIHSNEVAMHENENLWKIDKGFFNLLHFDASKIHY